MKRHVTSVFALLLSGLLLGACSNETSNEPQPSNPVTELASDKTLVSIEASATLDPEEALDTEELRAMGNLKFWRDRLLPQVTEGKVKILMLFASTNYTVSSKPIEIHEADWTYDEDNKTLKFRGDVPLDPDLMTTNGIQGLRMMLVAAPTGSYDAQTKRLKMEAPIATKAEMEAGNGFAIPYFSEWTPLANYIRGGMVDLHNKTIVLKPQGQVLRLSISDKQTLIPGNKLKRVFFESNVMARQGYYDLAYSTGASLITHTYDNEKILPWTPTDQSIGVAGTTGGIDFSKHPLPAETFYTEIAQTDAPVLSTTPIVYYLWAEARPNVTNPYTRGYMEFNVTKPLLPEAFVNGEANWQGLTTPRRVPVYYSTNNYKAPGATAEMVLDKYNVTTLLSRFPTSFAAAKTASDAAGIQHNEFPIKLLPYNQRNYTHHTEYRWTELARMNYVGLSAQPIKPDVSEIEATYPEVAKYEWRIPSLQELGCILPYAYPLASATMQVATKGTDGTYTAVARGTKKGSFVETISTGGRHDAPLNYRTYFFNGGQETDGSFSVYAVRLAQQSSLPNSGDSRTNRHKAMYAYRCYANAGAEKRLVVQAHHLGACFPEIKDATSTETWQPFVQSLITPEERTLPQTQWHWLNTDGNHTPYTGLGVKVWVNLSNLNQGSGAGLHYYINFASSYGVMDTQNNVATFTPPVASLILIRDLY